MYGKKTKYIDSIESNIPIKNDMDFASWKAELNKELTSFWESITEETQE